MVKRNIVNCKRGWIRLVEVFVSIVLLTGVLLVITSRNSSYNTDIQKEISEKQTAILRDIELNTMLREEILNAAGLPVEWEEFESEVPFVKQRINDLTPPDLGCIAKICMINELCLIDDAVIDAESFSGEDIYVKAAVISAEPGIDVYSPRELKLFCIKKG